MREGRAWKNRGEEGRKKNSCIELVEMKRILPKQYSNAVPNAWNASVSLARFYLPLAGFYASETLAYLSGETPEFLVQEFYCIIWV